MFTDFELTSNDDGSMFVDLITNDARKFKNLGDTFKMTLNQNVRTWCEAKKIFAAKGYRGKFMLLEKYDEDGNSVVHHVTLK